MYKSKLPKKAIKKHYSNYTHIPDVPACVVYHCVWYMQFANKSNFEKKERKDGSGGWSYVKQLAWSFHETFIFIKRGSKQTETCLEKKDSVYMGNKSNSITEDWSVQNRKQIKSAHRLRSGATEVTLTPHPVFLFLHFFIYIYFFFRLFSLQP